MLYLLLNATPADGTAGGWLMTIIQLGSFGLVAYLVYYATAVWWPKEQQRQKEERESREVAHQAELARRDAASSAALKDILEDANADRENYKASLKLMEAAAAQIRHDSREREAALVAKLGLKDQQIIDLLKEFREQRDLPQPRVQT